MNKDRIKSDLKIFGALIRRMRRELDWTQTQLGKKIGLTAGSICKIEKGLNPMEYGTVLRLSDALGGNVAELYLKVELRSRNSIGRVPASKAGS